MPKAKKTAETDTDQILYKILNLSKTASKKEIKSQFRKLSYKFHPDKNSDKDSVSNFQKINEAYKILSDEKKRKYYDKTGNIENMDISKIDSFLEAYKFYRKKFKEISEKDIDEFYKSYKFSKEEEKDLLDFYFSKKGNIRLILENIILSENEDVERFVKFYQEKIKNKEIVDYIDKFNLMKKRIKKFDGKEEKEALEALEQKKNDFKNLKDTILAKYNKEETDGFFGYLENKFCQPKIRKKMKKKIKKTGKSKKSKN